MGAEGEEGVGAACQTPLPAWLLVLPLLGVKGKQEFLLIFHIPTPPFAKIWCIRVLQRKITKRRRTHGTLYICVHTHTQICMRT